MEIKVSESDGISLISLMGKLDTGTSPAAEEVVLNALEQGSTKMVIDLSHTEYLSSSGLRVLLVAAKRISAIRGKLIISNPNPVVKEILDISGFSTILDVRTSTEEAISAMQL